MGGSFGVNGIAMEHGVVLLCIARMRYCRNGLVATRLVMIHHERVRHSPEGGAHCDAESCAVGRLVVMFFGVLFRFVSHSFCVCLRVKFESVFQALCVLVVVTIIR